MPYIRSDQIMVFDSQTDLASVSPASGQLGLTLDLQKIFEYNGTTWIPFSTTNVKKSTVVVNGKTTGTTKVYTVEATTLKFYPFLVIFRAVSISGVTLAPTLSVGTNSTSYNNISTSSLLSTVLSTLGAGSGAPQSATYSVPIAGSTDIYANVTIAAVATSYTFNVEVLGFYDI